MMRFRPVGLSRPALALVALTAALFAIARTTGSGWLIVLLSLVAATAVAAALLPGIHLLRVHVEGACPRDATAGRPLPLRLTFGRPVPLVKVRGIDPPGIWAVAEGAVEATLEVVPEHRGVLNAAVVELRCAAPLGLIWWRRRVEIELDHACSVGPRPVAMPVPSPEAGARAGLEAAAARSGTDAVRSVRDYRPGDPIRLVHWPATARTGEHIVKELEGMALPAVAVVADLAAGDTELAAARAAGVCNAALDAGVSVTLFTTERHGPVAGLVRSHVEVSRRLARAVPGAVAPTRVRAGTRVLRVDGRPVERSHWEPGA